MPREDPSSSVMSGGLPTAVPTRLQAELIIVLHLLMPKQDNIHSISRGSGEPVKRLCRGCGETAQTVIGGPSGTHLMA